MSEIASKKTPSFQFKSFKELQTLFGPPPVLDDEDPEAYVAIGQAIWDARPPEDFIQATRINDITYLLWEGSRMRRMKVNLIETSKVDGARKLLSNLTDKYLDDDFWIAWARGDEKIRNVVQSILTNAGLGQNAITAQTIEVIIGTLEAIERQSSQFEARRLVTIREFDQYSENAERRRDRAEEVNKQIKALSSRRTRKKVDEDLVSAPQLPLDVEAAE